MDGCDHSKHASPFSFICMLRFQHLPTTGHHLKSSSCFVKGHESTMWNFVWVSPQDIGGATPKFSGGPNLRSMLLTTNDTEYGEIHCIISDTRQWGISNSLQWRLCKLNGYDLLMLAKIWLAGNLSQNQQKAVVATSICFLTNFTELKLMNIQANYCCGQMPTGPPNQTVPQMHLYVDICWRKETLLKINECLEKNLEIS